MSLTIRREIISAPDPNLLYERWNLVCTGVNYFDTGFAPMSSENINKDFKISIKISSFDTVSESGGQETLFSCKYEGTLNKLSYPGFLIRRYNSGKTQFDVGGYSYWRPLIANMLDKYIYFWRISGSYYSQIQDDATVHTLNVRSTTFNQNLILGAAEKTDGTKFRFGACNIDHVRVEYI